MNKDNSIGLGIGLGVLTGAAIGGILALLFAPKSGTDTRQLIKDKTGEAVEILKTKAGAVIDSVNDVASESNRKGRAALHAIQN